MDRDNTPDPDTPNSQSSQHSRPPKSQSKQECRTSKSRPDHHKRMPRQKKAIAAAAAAAAERQSHRFMPYTPNIPLDEPNIRIQPQISQPPTFCWRSIPSEVFGDFVFMTDTPQHQTECLERTFPDSFHENDLFSEWLGNPTHVEKYQLYDQAPEMPVYDDRLVSLNRPSIELHFLKHAHWLYSSFCCLADFISSPAQHGITYRDALALARFQHFLDNEAWIQNLGQRSEDFPGNSLAESAELCGKVGGFTGLIEALVFMCWLGLYITYEGHLRRRYTIETVKASCCVEARRWCLRILRGWAEEEHAKWLTLYAPATPFPEYPNA